MQKLSDILANGSADKLRNQWGATEAASEFGPLPAGEYVAHIIGGELTASRTNHTPGYKLTFRVAAGEFAGRQFWGDIWLTEAALPMAKRDLAKLGIAELDQLEQPLPPGIRCRVKLALRKEDDGREFNRVRRFDVEGIDAPEPDAFAPTDGANGEGGGDEF